MKKYLVLAVVIILFFLIQATFLSRFSFFGLKPDLLFIFLILWAIRYGPKEGLVVGILTGILKDFWGPGVPLHIFSQALVGFLAGWLPVEFIKDQFFRLLSWVFWLSLSGTVLENLLLAFYLKSTFIFPWIFFIFMGAFNVMLVPLIYPVFFLKIMEE